MENQEQQTKSRVVKVESVASWEFYVSQATNQACPIVVHFTASWCIPSVAMNPFFEEVASAYPDVLFLNVDVDDVKGLEVVAGQDSSPDRFKEWMVSNLPKRKKASYLTYSASKMEVKAMPTFVMIKDGAQVDKLVGANPDEIRKRIDGFVQAIRADVA